jgi:hypothetical protein
MGLNERRNRAIDRIQEGPMRQWLRAHLTYANVMATIAVFFVLSGGTAVALTGTDTVQSDDLGPGSQVKAPDVAANAVNGPDVVNGSIAGADIANSALPTGRKITSSCDPSSSTFVDCGTLTINLPRSGLRVLIVASADWFSIGGGLPDEGSTTDGICRIGVNGAPFGPDAHPGEIQNVTDGSRRQSVTLTNVTDPNLGAGNHTFGLACNQTSGDISFPATYVSVVVLGPG